jgi:hypothetical protein
VRVVAGVAISRMLSPFDQRCAGCGDTLGRSLAADDVAGPLASPAVRLGCANGHVMRLVRLRTSTEINPAGEFSNVI